MTDWVARAITTGQASASKVRRGELAESGAAAETVMQPTWAGAMWRAET